MLSIDSYKNLFGSIRISLLLLLLNIEFSSPFSVGAPDRTCYQLLPSPKAHGPPDSSPSPYSIVPNNDLTFGAKENINVKIVSSTQPFYRGLLLQARIISNNGSYHLPVWQALDPLAKEDSVLKRLIAESIVGYWIPDANITKLIKCNDNYNKQTSQDTNKIDKMAILLGGDTLTHMSGDDKPVNVSHHWFPGPRELDDNTKIQFFATIIATRREYWVGVKSEPLTYVGGRFIMENE